MRALNATDVPEYREPLKFCLLQWREPFYLLSAHPKVRVTAATISGIPELINRRR
jgi:hypothetical protein